MPNQQVNVVLSIASAPNATTPLYRESHSVTTDAVGQLKLIIGNGTASVGSFAAIPWKSGLLYIEGTITVGDKVISLGSQILNTVPFAFYANQAGSIVGPNDIDNENELIDNITLINSVLHIVENGIDRTVNLATLKNDDDADATNEIQNLSLTGTVLSLSNSESTVNLNSLNTDSQTLSLNANSLSISGGNAVDLTSLKDDADANPTNEIQSLSISGSTLNISGANTPINLGPFLGTNTDEQTLSLSSGNLSISNGNSVALNPLITLQQAYTGGATVQLNGTNEFRVSTSGAAPLLSTDNTNNRIGIGTNTPNTLLEIRSATPGNSPDLRLTNSDNTHMMSLFAGRVGDANPFVAVSPGDPIRFAHYDGLAFNERMRISGTGSVGIGVVDPSYRLHIVAPTANFTSPGGIDFEVGTLVTATETTVGTINNVGIASTIAGSGINYAIYGEAFNDNATNNRGVYGRASGTAAESNLGVYGAALGAAPINTGVRGLAGGGTTNYGVLAENSDVGTTNYGTYSHGHFGTTTNYGTYSTASGTGTTNYGIYSTATGATSNWAGYFVGNLRVTGNSVSGTNNALYAEQISTSTGFSRGVHGHAQGGTSDNIGVYGSASNASLENVGVRGYAGGGTINRGVIGHNTAAGTTNYGGFFHARLGTANNYGVYAQATEAGTNNYGIYATATGATNNYAGHFVGAVNITGTLSVTNFASGHSLANGILQKGSAQLIDLRHSGIYSGANAGNANTGVAFRNIAIGQNALTAQTNGSDNLAIGNDVLQNPTNFSSNIGIGSFAFSGATGTLSGNIGIGVEALQNLASSNYNTALGFRSMEDYVSGGNNTAIGYYALHGAGGGSNNVAVGSSALPSSTTGSNNVALGYNSGAAVTTESNNVLLGPTTNIAAGVSNAVALGNGATAGQNDAIILGNSSVVNVKVGIGTNTPLEKLHVDGNVIVAENLQASTINGVSDRRLKTDIVSLTNTLKTIERIQGVSFHWLNKNDKTLQHGVIAQEIEKILPEIVRTDVNGFKSVNYIALIPFLIEAIKEQQSQIDQLRKINARQDELEDKINALAAQLSAIQHTDASKRTTEK